LKELALLGSERMTDIRVGSILSLAVKISTPTPILEQAYRMVFKEHSIYQKINRQSIAVAVAANGHLKGNSWLQSKVRHELSQQFSADRL
jgi:hypothetical protein